MKNITPRMLRAILSYDAITGEFKWIVTRHGTKLNKHAGTDNYGYISIRINGQNYFAHRLAWLWMTGRWPIHELDHINGHRSDNRWCNLREATRSCNAQNQRRPHKRNKVGYLGVYKLRKGFGAAIGLKGQKRLYLGPFNKAIEAHKAYLKAKRILHPHWVE